MIPRKIGLLLVILAIHAASFAQTRTVFDVFGAIIRGDTTEKKIAIVFTGDQFADGGKIIRATLAKHEVKAGFFLTGNFYSNPQFKTLIKSLKKDRHYLGAHSDKHLLYNDWTRRDSLLVTNEEFVHDLTANYERMARFGATKSEAAFFLPPYEWYNKTVSEWTKELGLQLINFTPGTRSTADYTFPEMGKAYVDSEKIYQSIVTKERTDPNGLNGFILLIHIGTDPRRTDKFYNRLDSLLSQLKLKGYTFVRIDSLLQE